MENPSQALIDQATVDDIPALSALLTALFSQEADFCPDPAKQKRGLEMILAAPERGRIFVARVNGEVAGMASLLFSISTAEGSAACWLEDMVIRPDRRDHGLGSRLLEHAIHFAKTHGFARITLLTDQTNEKAIRFYQRQGFRLSGMVPLRLHLDK